MIKFTKKCFFLYLSSIPNELTTELKTISSEYKVSNDQLYGEETFNILFKLKSKATSYVELNNKKEVNN